MRALGRVLVLVSAALLGCKDKDDAKPADRPLGDSIANAANAGACVSIEGRTLNGLVGAAQDRGIHDLDGVERELRDYLHGRCIAEGWTTTVVPKLLDCNTRPHGQRKACYQDALAPVFAHRADFEAIYAKYK